MAVYGSENVGETVRERGKVRPENDTRPAPYPLKMSKNSVPFATHICCLPFSCSSCPNIAPAAYHITRSFSFGVVVF